jgi:preprotein translocase subunit YajC
MQLPADLLFLALAPTPQQGGQAAAPSWMGFVPLALLLVIFYFLLIRPQQKKAREHQELLKTLRAGDQVVTSGGIIGTITNVKEKTVIIRSAADDKTRLEITKASVGEILERSGDASEPAKS